MSRDGLLLHLRKYSNLDNTRLFLTSRLNVDIPRTIDSLCKQISSSRVRAALEVLPTAVFATYDDAFKRIVDQSKDHAEFGMRVTSLVFCAMRSLMIEELGHALAVQTGDCTLDRGDLTDHTWRHSWTREHISERISMGRGIFV